MTSEKHIYLLRHAESVSNARSLSTSKDDEPLSELGLQQAKNAAVTVSQLPIQTIICSPLERAIKTATPISGRMGITPDIRESFKEGHFIDCSIPYGVIQDETDLAFLKRVRDSASYLLDHPSEQILVVTHGHFMRELLNLFLETKFRIRFPHDNCGLTKLTIGDEVMVNYINRTTLTNSE